MVDILSNQMLIFWEAVDVSAVLKTLVKEIKKKYWVWKGTEWNVHMTWSNVVMVFIHVFVSVKQKSLHDFQCL